MNFGRTAARTLAAGLALAAATSLAAAQTVCGTWEPLVDGLIGDIAGVQTRAQGLAVFDAGDGPMLYLAGNFEAVVDPVFGEVRAPGLARWDGERWSAVPGLDGPGLEMDRRAITLEVYDDGSGPALYVGGEFTVAAGMEANGIARWDGATWSVLDGPGKPPLGSQVNDIQPHDFGDGEALYLGGQYLTGTSPPVDCVRRWDGAQWTLAGANQPFGTVTDLASFGGRLFAGGPFSQLGGERSPGIAVFDGDAWSTPASPGQSVGGSEYRILVPTEIDGRQALVAGGTISIDLGDGGHARRLAAWDGERWSSLDPTGPDGAALPLDVVRFDDGTGDALYVGGLDIGRPSSVGRLVGGVLHPLANMRNGIVFNVFVHDSGAGEELLAAGVWRDASGFEHFLSRWRPTERCALDLSGDCVLDLFDFVALQNLFMAGDPKADFDGDGELTIFDFLAFQNAFDAGCP
jgi:hypothetical protein